MINFFRKIRYNLMAKNKTSKYLKYAIGEIILVVIGILIALQLNNWNEKNQKQNELTDIYKIIKTDLIKDTTRLTNTEKIYISRIQAIQNLIDKKISKTYFDTITAANFEDCRYCRHIANTYNHVFIKENGFELLKQHKVETIDTLSSQLLSFFKTVNEFFIDDNTILKGLGRENGKLLEKYDWYPYFKEYKYHPDYINYISESQEYINKLSTYSFFAKLMVADINYFKSEAKYYIEAINTIVD